MLFHNPVHRGKPQARALAAVLGGEERLEQVAARVAHPCRCRYRARKAARTAGAVNPAHRQSFRQDTLAVSMVSVPPSGMASRAFTDEVHHHLLQLPAIGLHHADVGAQHGAQLDILADHAAQHLLQFEIR